MQLVKFVTSNITTNESVLLEWWNEYASEVLGGDDVIYTSLEEMAEMLGDSPEEFAKRVYFGNVESWYAPFFSFDGYANIVSHYDLFDTNSPFDLDALVAWAVETGHDGIAALVAQWEAEQGE